ncbi:hypothetical protein QOZ80_1AG0001720 [Eleusine coracana subsp. coracana]|nr:hypothetical protein QOZ80_1AG0001720 [Eleusine coracana subsp. coracana]
MPRAAVAREYAAIFNFGDSLADAGNLCVDGIPDYLVTARPPYGQTYFGYPTGRVSDGRVVVDFIAQELGLPLLPPPKARNATFYRGANYVAGHGLLPRARAGPRRLELGLPARPDQVVPGHETIHLQQLHPRVQGFVPSVAVHRGRVRWERLRGAAVRVPAGGGCARHGAPRGDSIFFPKENQETYYGPRTGCVRELNTLSWVHNAALQRKIAELRKKHPGVRIVYADYYTPAIQFVLHAEKWGEFIRSPLCLRSASQMFIVGHGDWRARSHLHAEIGYHSFNF